MSWMHESMIALFCFVAGAIAEYWSVKRILKSNEHDINVLKQKIVRLENKKYE